MLNQPTSARPLTDTELNSLANIVNDLLSQPDLHTIDAQYYSRLRLWMQWHFREGYNDSRSADLVTQICTSMENGTLNLGRDNALLGAMHRFLTPEQAADRPRRVWDELLQDFILRRAPCETKDKTTSSWVVETLTTAVDNDATDDPSTRADPVLDTEHRYEFLLDIDDTRECYRNLIAEIKKTQDYLAHIKDVYTNPDSDYDAGLADDIETVKGLLREIKASATEAAEQLPDTEEVLEDLRELEAGEILKTPHHSINRAGESIRLDYHHGGPGKTLTPKELDDLLQRVRGAVENNTVMRASCYALAKDNSDHPAAGIDYWLLEYDRPENTFARRSAGISAKDLEDYLRTIFKAHYSAH